MRYLCLGYFNPSIMNGLPEAEIEAVMAECRSYMPELYKTGQVIVDAGLELETKYLRRVDGRVKVTDGPFAEAKELIGSAFIIEAADMEEAIRVASLHPTTMVGAGEQLGWRVEIRPIHYFEQRA